MVIVQSLPDFMNGDIVIRTEGSFHGMQTGDMGVVSLRTTRGITMLEFQGEHSEAKLLVIKRGLEVLDGYSDRFVTTVPSIMDGFILAEGNLHSICALSSKPNLLAMVMLEIGGDRQELKQLIEHVADISEVSDIGLITMEYSATTGKITLNLKPIFSSVFLNNVIYTDRYPKLLNSREVFIDKLKHLSDTFGSNIFAQMDSAIAASSSNQVTH